MTESTSRDRGQRGEELAARYLKRKGYELVAQNYRSRFGEIDLIVRKGELLVFCEVKTRKDDRFSAAREAVDFRKQRRIILTASRFLAAEGVEYPSRFDVIEVYLGEGIFARPRINHLENAFTL